METSGGGRAGGAPAFHLPSTSFLDTWLCSQSFHYGFSSKTLPNLYMHVQMSTRTCTRVCAHMHSTAFFPGLPGALPGRLTACMLSWTLHPGRGRGVQC